MSSLRLHRQCRFVNEQGQTVIRTKTRFRTPDGRVQEQVSEQVVGTGGGNPFGGGGPGGQQMTPEEMARLQKLQKEAQAEMVREFKLALGTAAKEAAKAFARKKINDVSGWFKKRLS